MKPEPAWPLAALIALALLAPAGASAAGAAVHPRQALDYPFESELVAAPAWRRHRLGA